MSEFQQHNPEGIPEGTRTLEELIEATKGRGQKRLEYIYADLNTQEETAALRPQPYYRVKKDKILRELQNQCLWEDGRLWMFREHVETLSNGDTCRNIMAVIAKTDARKADYLFMISPLERGLHLFGSQESRKSHLAELSRMSYYRTYNRRQLEAIIYMHMPRPGKVKTVPVDVDSKYL